MLAAAADYRPRVHDILIRRRGCGLFITMADGRTVLCKMPRFENLEKATRKSSLVLQTLWETCLLAYIMDFDVAGASRLPPAGDVAMSGAGGVVAQAQARDVDTAITIKLKPLACPYCNISFEVSKLLHAHLVDCPVASFRHHVYEDKPLDPKLAVLLQDFSGGHEKMPIPVVNDVSAVQAWRRLIMSLPVEVDCGGSEILVAVLDFPPEMLCLLLCAGGRRLHGADPRGLQVHRHPYLQQERLLVRARDGATRRRLGEVHGSHPAWRSIHRDHRCRRGDSQAALLPDGHWPPLLHLR